MDEMNNTVTEEALENVMEVPFEDTPVVETVTTETEELELTAPGDAEVSHEVTSSDVDNISWKDSVELGAKVGVYCGTVVVTTFGIMKAAEWVGNKIGNAINKRSEKKAAEKEKKQQELERIASMTPEEVKAEMDAKAAESQK